MAMNQLGLHYRSHNRVVEYEHERLITWQTTGQWHGTNIVGGQRWRFELIPSAHRTLVRHSYLWGTARFALVMVWLPGYPRRMERTMPYTLERLETVALKNHDIGDG